MVMKRLPDRFSKPPVLENARNVDADVAAPVSGAPLVVKDGIWQPETEITTAYFTRKADVAIAAGQPVTVTATGVIPAVNGSVHGIAVAAVAAGSTCLILRQGKLTLPTALTPNTLLYIDDDTGALTDTPGAKAYYIGYTSETGDTGYVFFGGSGGGSGGGGGGTADGVTIVDNDGTLSVVSTSSPKPNTVIRTQDNGKISPDLLDSTNLFSGMQVRYLVPQGTTWDREPDKCITTPDLPLVVQKRANFVFTSPFGNKPALAQVWVFSTVTGVWTLSDVIFGSSNETIGLTVNCPGDGSVYLATGDWLSSATQGSNAPLVTENIASGEVVIALYCQVTEAVATHIVGSRKKYLIAPDSSWDKGDTADYITLPDMPTKVAGGAAKSWKLSSPFGAKLVQTEAWIKFAGRWNRGEELIYSNAGDYRLGVRSACPGDGFIYVNIGSHPQNTDTTTNLDNIPIGSTGTVGKTYKDYEICIVASVQDAVELPTISGKELADCLRLDPDGWQDITAVPSNGGVQWTAPANGYLRVCKPPITEGYGGVLRSAAEYEARPRPWQLAVNTYNGAQTAYMPVSAGESFYLARTAADVRLEFRAETGCEAKYAIYSKTGGGGPVNPEDAIRVGEVRNYNRYDTEISSNPSFVDISEAVEVNTNDYPDFAALVEVTGMYPIPPALNVGGQTLPYIYLGKFTGTTPPEKLPADILITSDEGATGSIIFVTDDGSLDIAVSMAAVGDEDTALTSPGLLFNVGTDTGMIPIDAVLKATSDVNAEPDTPGLLIRYEKKS